MTHLKYYTDVTRRGSQLQVRGYDENGHKTYDTFKYRPTLYIKSKSENAPWASLHGEPLEPYHCDSMSEANEFVKKYKDIPGYQVHGNLKHVPAFIQTHWPDEIEYNPSDIDVVFFDIETAIDDSGFPDPTVAAQEVLTITIKSSNSDAYIAWGLKPYNHESTEAAHLELEYRQFECEEDMLTDFLKWWNFPENTPDIISGWNSEGFDIPYLINRIVRVLGSKAANALSPWGSISERTTTSSWGNDIVRYNIAGVQQLDYMELFKKFTVLSMGAQESYKLDFIAEAVLGTKKLDYSHIGDGSLRDLYEKDFNVFMSYNIIDVELLVRMDEKLALMDLVFEMAYTGGVNFVDTLGTVGIWDSLICRYLHSKNIAVPPETSHESQAYGGGYVKEVVPGKYNWVMSFDLASLYPNIIIQHNTSTETLVNEACIDELQMDYLLDQRIPKMLKDEKDPEHEILPISTEYSMTANGAAFRRDKQGFLPAILEGLYARRKEIKNEMLECMREQSDLKKANINDPRVAVLEKRIAMLNTKQLATKTLLNSSYGALANKYFRYFDVNIAAGITATGRLIIQTAEKAANTYFQSIFQDEKDRVIAVDTDSNYYDMSDFVKRFNPTEPVEFLDSIGKDKVEPVLAHAFDKLGKLMNVYKPRMLMEREVIADNGIFLAKKRYMLNVIDNEGVRFSEPKIKMMGIEAIKSSTPKVCREEMKTLIRTLLTGTEEDAQEMVEQFRTQFYQLDPEDVGIPRGVTSVRKYSNRDTIFGKGTPINSKAALVYNHTLRQRKLNMTYPPITDGDKLKYLYMKQPNSFGSNVKVFGFPHTVPNEFKAELKQYIDYPLQFQKSFLDPVMMIFKAIGWNPEPVASLDAFFG